MRINIFGASGTGKSTLAAWMFSELKVQGYSIEHVQETIKQAAWLGIKPHGWRGFTNFAKQLSREYELLAAENGPRNIITDSPILLGAIYSEYYNKEFADEMFGLVEKFDRKYDCVSILLQRQVPYSTEGRYETKEESEKMDIWMFNWVTDYINKTDQALIIRGPQERDELIEWSKTYLDV
jgi:nicotinamide riboside kinase